MYRRDIVTWIWENWLHLQARGNTIELPEWMVEHPAHRPDLFVPVDGWPKGQTCDYGWSLLDKSRVHAQCFTVDGVKKIRVHLDRYDPNQGLDCLVQHAVEETPVRDALKVAGVGLLLFAGLKLLTGALKK